ncbi:MAG TPA: hypothetical protein VK742_07440 [Candidatus Sulfotelmatobacter sp.]|jgi:hypothetical protein|nr:hypothetical protein [Candidatus Sulfotelmatobacter sp.]
MIFINQNALPLPPARRTAMNNLSMQLMGKPVAERTEFINQNRNATWAHAEVLTALRDITGNKCWYSEVQLDGADPNVDHFRPKGRVREVDADLLNTGHECAGYWWLAFEFSNYRLAAMHANQRRVDTNTAGGKWDYFPIRGNRTADGTPLGEIMEDFLALDPCSPTDVRLLWFDPDGKPCVSNWKRKPNAGDVERVKATIWLYHLDKQEIQSSRAKYVEDIRKDLRNANTDFRLWNRDSANPNLQARNSFNQKIAEIEIKIADDAVFAGAKRCVIRAAISEYPWIEEFIPN